MSRSITDFFSYKIDDTTGMTDLPMYKDLSRNESFEIFRKFMKENVFGKLGYHRAEPVNLMCLQREFIRDWAEGNLDPDVEKYREELFYAMNPIISKLDDEINGNVTNNRNMRTLTGLKYLLEKYSNESLEWVEKYMEGKPPYVLFGKVIIEKGFLEPEEKNRLMKVGVIELIKYSMSFALNIIAVHETYFVPKNKPMDELTAMAYMVLKDFIEEPVNRFNLSNELSGIPGFENSKPFDDPEVQELAEKIMEALSYSMNSIRKISHKPLEQYYREAKDLLQGIIDSKEKEIKEKQNRQNKNNLTDDDFE